MPSSAGPLDRRAQRQRSQAKLPRRGGKRTLVLFVLGLTATVGGLAAGIWWQMNRNLPDLTTVKSFTRGGTLVIQAADGQPILQLGPTARNKAKIDQIPQPLVHAFIATEDERFYQHGGVDAWGIVRAAVANFRAGDVVQGGSTISQQLSRMLFLDQERSIWRKLREVAVAQELERRLSKQDILELYLNQVYLGSGAYGVTDAAWVYFSKPLKELSLLESATLAGLAAAPSDYSPLVNPDLAQRRRNRVLERLVDAGYLDQDEAHRLTDLPLDLKPGSVAEAYSTAPYFATYVQQELPKYLTADQIEAGGLIIQTSLNLSWQRAAEKAVQRAVAYDGPRLNFDQAALVAIDPKNGEIRTMVGGTDFGQSQFNRATQAQRQPGSTFKLFVYAAALAKDWTPFDYYRDAPYSIADYEPKNFSDRYRGDVTLTQALASSLNVVAVKLLVDVGLDPVLQLAKDLGIQSPLTHDYSLALGSSEVNLLELTGAYGVLANRGLQVEPHGIRRIIRASTGEVLYDALPQAHRVLSDKTATVIAWMLQQVVVAGTGRPAQLGERPVAGKTGTSEKGRDLWFIGFVPQLVAGVWLGNDNSSPTQGTSRAAAVTWQEFMAEVTESLPIETFPELPQLRGRGLRADDNAAEESASGGGSSGGNSGAAEQKAAPEGEEASTATPAAEPPVDSAPAENSGIAEPPPVPATEAPPEVPEVQEAPLVPVPAPANP